MGGSSKKGISEMEKELLKQDIDPENLFSTVLQTTDWQTELLATVGTGNFRSPTHVRLANRLLIDKLTTTVTNFEEVKSTTRSSFLKGKAMEMDFDWTNRMETEWWRNEMEPEIDEASTSDDEGWETFDEFEASEAEGDGGCAEDDKPEKVTASSAEPEPQKESAGASAGPQDKEKAGDNQEQQGGAAALPPKPDDKFPIHIFIQKIMDLKKQEFDLEDATDLLQEYFKYWSFANKGADVEKVIIKLLEKNVKMFEGEGDAQTKVPGYVDFATSVVVDVLYEIVQEYVLAHEPFINVLKDVLEKAQQKTKGKKGAGKGRRFQAR